MQTRTVLIVEDNVSILAAYMQILDSIPEDIIPMVAPTFEKARKIFSVEEVDVIILDHVLPDALGADMLEEIRKDHPHTPIFLVTGHPEMVDWEKTEACHVSHVFSKPFDTLMLIDALRRSFREERC